VVAHNTDCVSTFEPPPLRPDSEISASIHQHYLEIQGNESQQPLATPAKDWNEKFQVLLQQTFIDPSHELQRTVELRQLCHQFAGRSQFHSLIHVCLEEATAIGVQIINELFVPRVQRKIQSITRAVGGLAGGL
jgi:hypothetical protein